MVDALAMLYDHYDCAYTTLGYDRYLDDQDRFP